MSSPAIQPRPARSERSERAIFATGTSWYKALDTSDLDRRGCFRNQVQDTALDAIMRQLQARPVYYDDGRGAGTDMSPQTLMREAACSLREAEICLRDLIDSGMVDRPDNRSALSGVYRPRPDRWSDVAPYAERETRRKAKEREQAQAQRKAAPAKPPEPTRETLIALPGRPGVTTTLSAELSLTVRAPARSASPVSYYADYANGALTVEVWTENAPRPAPHEKAKEKRSTAAIAPPDAPAAKPPEKAVAHYGAQIGADVVENKQNALQELLQGYAMHLLRQPDAPLLDKIARTLGDAPLPFFDAVLKKRITKPHRGDREGRHSPALLTHLAIEARRNFEHRPPPQAARTADDGPEPFSAEWWNRQEGKTENEP